MKIELRTSKLRDTRSTRVGAVAMAGEELHTVFSRFEDNVKYTLERARQTKREYNEIKERQGSRAAFAYLARSMHYNV